jgi:GNAT superfamily N-acetyltransferase
VETRRCSSPDGEISIVEVLGEGDMLDFIEFPLRLYGDDPLYSPQLTRDLKVHFSPENPFFDHAEVSFFLAHRSGRIVGRIASIINHLHLEVQHEKAGFFGFFECVNDTGVAAALLDRVRDRLREQGLPIMRGPMNFSTNEECGFLLDGFKEPAILMMPYNPPYYNELADSYGMRKSKDLNAYIKNVTGDNDLPEKLFRVAAIAEKRGFTARKVTKDYFGRAMRNFMDIYNKSWEKNWGFVPITEREIAYSAKLLKPLVVPDLTIVAEHEGKPAGFMCMVPDYNFVLRKMGGRLNPLSIVRALYYSRKITDLRMMLLGIKPEYRNRGVDALLYREGFRGVRRGGYKRVDFSWILEDNFDIIRHTEMINAPLYKKYRIYEKEIA